MESLSVEKKSTGVEMTFLKRMLSEDGDVSAMRIMSFFSLLVASILSFVGIYKKVDLGGLSSLVGIFVGAAFGGKVAQKFAEIKATVTDKVSQK